MNINIDGNNYEIIKNYKDAFQNKEFEEKYTSFFKDYDYIVGDISYGKLRLKGFCKKGNKLFNNINNYNNLEKYLKENCSYDCKYFILMKKNV